MKNIVILTGAGISAESGIDTFRDAGGRSGIGIWEQHRVEDVATPEGFARNPGLVQRFYDMRRAAVQTVEPNPAHHALARLEREFSGELLLVTQNVDDLHERAGATPLHMHGELLSALCAICEARHPWSGTLFEAPPCPACGMQALRPDVVWFGEMPYQMGRIYAALEACDLNKWSPLHHADRIARPLLLMHGDADPVVPVEHSRALVDAIRAAAGDVEYVEFAGEGHGLRDPANRRREFDLVAGFLARTIGPSPSRDPEQ